MMCDIKRTIHCPGVGGPTWGRRLWGIGLGGARRVRLQLNGGHVREHQHLHQICAPPFFFFAIITGNSSLEPLIEGLCAQIHVNLG